MYVVFCLETYSDPKNKCSSSTNALRLIVFPELTRDNDVPDCIQKHDDHPDCTDHNTREHDSKLFKPQSKKGLQCRVHFFSQRVITYWNDLPSQVVTASSVNSFKSRLNNYWHQIGYGFSQALCLFIYPLTCKCKCIEVSSNHTIFNIILT